MLKFVSIIICVFYSSMNFSQNFSIHIDPGDFSNSKEVTTLYSNKINTLYIDWDKPIDTCFVEINNGKVIARGRISHSIIPKQTGNAKVLVTVKFKNGNTIKKSKIFKVIKYPNLILKVKNNSLLIDQSIEFDIYSGAKNVTSEFKVGYFELEILSKEKEVLINTPRIASLNLNLEEYNLKKGQTLRVSHIRLLWDKYNLPAFTKEFNLDIK